MKEILLEIYSIMEDLSKVIKSGELEPKTKYGLVFSENGSGAIRDLLGKLNLELEYYDPDEDYMDDVYAYWVALKELINPLIKVLFVYLEEIE